jgi:uncharacterized membrane protein
MPDGMQEDMVENNQRVTQRWKVMLALSTILIALGMCVDWSPSQDTSLPDTSSFLVILGVLLGFAGLLTATRR